jgi:hypothetical protein
MYVLDGSGLPVTTDCILYDDSGTGEDESVWQGASVRVLRPGRPYQEPKIRGQSEQVEVARYWFHLYSMMQYDAIRYGMI